MKKLANILLLFVMCFALVGCGKDKKDYDGHPQYHRSLCADWQGRQRKR